MGADDDDDVAVNIISPPHRIYNQPPPTASSAIIIWISSLFFCDKNTYRILYIFVYSKPYADVLYTHLVRYIAKAQTIKMNGLQAHRLHIDT